MKKKFINALHALFRSVPFEQLLYAFAKNSFIGSFASKLVPPNFTYPNPTYKKVQRNGYHIHLNINDYNDWKVYWSLKEEEREELYKLAQNAKTVVDIGVNNGWVLMNLAKIIKANDGHVYGFEPYPPTFKRSSDNINSNSISNVTLYNLGCGHINSEMKMMNVVATNSGQNRIVSGNESGHEDGVQIVKVVKLDEQLGEVQKIDLIKIDVEGFEKNVLEGATAILQKDKPVIFIEMDDILLKANNSSAKELIGFFEQFNYMITKAKDGTPLNSQMNFDNCHYDIICK